jgi:hypothetical protein
MKPPMFFHIVKISSLLRLLIMVEHANHGRGTRYLKFHTVQG